MIFWSDYLLRRKNRWARGLLVTLALTFLVARLYGAAHFYAHSTQLGTLAAAGKHTTLQGACELCVAAAKLDKSWSAPITLIFLRAPRFQCLTALFAPITRIAVARHYSIRGPPQF